MHDSVVTMALSLPALLSFLVLPLLLLFWCQTKSKSKSKSNTPPGPRRLPIIGNLHQLGPIAHRSLYNLSKTYGPLFRLNLGAAPTLVVSSPSLAQQVLKTHDLACCSRPSLVTIQEYSFNGCDIAAAAYGDHWRNLRRIFILELLSPKKLRAFVSPREEETRQMIQSIKARADTRSPVNITEHVIRLTNNLICRVALGCKYDGEYGERSGIQGILEEAHALMASFFAADYFPVLRWIDTLTGRMRRLKRNSRQLDEFYQEVIDQHLKDGEKKEGCEEDIVDVMLRLWREGEQLSMDHIKGAIMSKDELGILTISTLNKDITVFHGRTNFRWNPKWVDEMAKNIIIAGTDTSAVTIIWAMAELIRNPRVMRKAQNAIRGVIGKKGQVEESDLLQLQYLKFIVNETLRLHPALPLLIPRETIKHCEINGYNVSPKTRILVNVWAIGRDENAWENPEEFNPDRYTGSPVDYIGHDFQFLPFGAGRRICPGINFGTSTTELALANLLYAFNWELPPDMEKEDIDMYEAPGFVTRKKTDLCLLATNK